MEVRELWFVRADRGGMELDGRELGSFVMGLEQFSLDGRVALITGSSRGIGFALAKALGEAGATVVLNARTADDVDRAVAELTERGITAHAMPFDVCDESVVTEAVDRIEVEVGPIDIVINNAGIQRRGPLLDFALDDFRELIDVNLTAAFIVSRAVARHMADRGAGKIVNVASVQAVLGRSTIAPYAASKGGLRLLTQGMCAELGPMGIQVNAFAPGYFATDLTASLVDDPDFTEWLEKRTPAARWGEVSELGGTAIFLCSSASDFVNGQMICVDGGMTAVV